MAIAIAGILAVDMIWLIAFLIRSVLIITAERSDEK